MANLTQQQVLSGPLAKIKIGNNVVGWGRTANLAIDYGVDAVYALGDILPVEHDPLRWSATLTIDEFVIRRDRLAPNVVQLVSKVPIDTKGGTAPGDLADVLLRETLTIEIVDEQDVALFKCLDCTPQNFSVRVEANQLSGQNATFAVKGLEGGFPQL